MTASCNLQLIVHGSLVLLLAQAAGVAFARALRVSAEASDRWRMSHAACSAGGVLLVALGPVVPHLHTAPVPDTAFVFMLIASTYALCIGTVIAAASGQRGISPGPPRANGWVHAAYVVGAVGSLLATLLLVYGAIRAAWEV